MFIPHAKINIIIYKKGGIVTWTTVRASDMGHSVTITTSTCQIASVTLYCNPTSQVFTTALHFFLRPSPTLPIPLPAAVAPCDATLTYKEKSIRFYFSRYFHTRDNRLICIKKDDILSDLSLWQVHEIYS